MKGNKEEQTGSKCGVYNYRYYNDKVLKRKTSTTPEKSINRSPFKYGYSNGWKNLLCNTPFAISSNRNCNYKYYYTNCINILRDSHKVGNHVVLTIPPDNITFLKIIIPELN
jgi:hypothetical protein